MGQFAYLYGLHVIGILFGLLFKKRLPIPFLCITGFFWGAVLWVVVALMLMTLSLPYTLASMLIVLGLVVVALVVIHIKQGTWRLSSYELYWLGGSLLAAALVIFAAVSTNYARATADSLALIVLGRNYAQDGLTAWSISRLSDWGVFVPVLFSANVFIGQDYLHALLPTISFFYFASFFVLGYLAVKKLLSSVLKALVVSAIVSILLASTYIVAFQVFYVHTNQPSAAFLLLAVASFWFATSEENSAWLIFGTIATLGFSLMRTEGPLFALIPLVLFLSSGKASYKERLLVTLPLAAVLLLWYIKIACGVTAGDGVLTPVRALAMVAPLIALAGFTALTYFRIANQFMKQLSYLMLVALLFVCVVFFLVIPEHMIESTNAILTNLLTPSRWGFTWFIILSMIPLFFKKSKLPYEKILSYVSPAYLMLLVTIAYARNPYHTGFYDSANRLMTQILPVAMLYGTLKFLTIEWNSEGQEDHSYRMVLILTSLLVVGVLLSVVAKVCPIQAEHLRWLYRAYRVGTVGVLGILALVLTTMVVSERAARLGYAGFVILLVLSGIIVNIRNLSYWKAFERIESYQLVDLAVASGRPNWELFEATYELYRGRVLLTNLDVYEEIESRDNKFFWWGGFQMVEYPSTPIALTAEQMQQFSTLPSTEEVVNNRTYVMLSPTEALTEIWFAKYDDKYYFIPVELIAEQD
ncbi:MAG: hypothetical protein JXJ17_14950 [Anaerolineae bacterium]|nr:hypothetical protein [Anaerolineae bacterium]